MQTIHGLRVYFRLPDDQTQGVKSHTFSEHSWQIGASCLVGKKELLEMLDIVVEKGLTNWVEEIRIREQEGGKEVNRNTT